MLALIELVPSGKAKNSTIQLDSRWCRDEFQIEMSMIDSAVFDRRVVSDT